jgi:hypothetical protein
LKDVFFMIKRKKRAFKAAVGYSGKQCCVTRDVCERQRSKEMGLRGPFVSNGKGPGILVSTVLRQSDVS